MSSPNWPISGYTLDQRPSAHPRQPDLTGNLPPWPGLREHQTNLIHKVFIMSLLSKLIPVCILLLLVPAASHGTSGNPPIEASYYLLEDPGQDLTIQQVRQRPVADWQPLVNLAPNFSFSNSRYWIKLELTNKGEEPRQLVLDLEQPLQDYIDAWYISSAGDVLDYWQTGDRRPAEARPLAYRGFAFPLQIPGHDARTLYLGLDTHDGLYDSLPLSLTSYLEFHNKRQIENLWFGFCYGAIVVLLLYNLIIGLVTRSGNFLSYSLYLAMFLLWNLPFRGYASYFSLPGGTWWNNAAVGVFSVCLFLTLNAFTLRFLQLTHNAPWLRKGLLLACGLMLYPLWLAITGVYSTTFAVLIPIAMINMVLILLAATRLSLQGNRSARIFLLAWTLLILSAFAYYARVLDLLPSTWLTENALNIGSLVEMLVLALALADRIKQLERQQLEDKTSLIRRERELKEELQKQVDQQTRELREVNRRLAQDSVTDSLTGLLNRRTFLESLGNQLKHGNRTGCKTALIVLDIDHFKKVNDLYGHPEGDRVLQQVATLIRKHWQRTTDQLYRLGGEEFGIVVSGTPAAYLRDKLSSLSSSLSESLTGPAGERGLTVSAGVAIIPPDEQLSAEQVYSLADKALYESKVAGRNTCRFILPGQDSLTEAEVPADF